MLHLTIQHTMGEHVSTSNSFASDLWTTLESTTDPISVRLSTDYRIARYYTLQAGTLSLHAFTTIV